MQKKRKDVSVNHNSSLLNFLAPRPHTVEARKKLKTDPSSSSQGLTKKDGKTRSNAIIVEDSDDEPVNGSANRKASLAGARNDRFNSGDIDIIDVNVLNYTIQPPHHVSSISKY